MREGLYVFEPTGPGDGDPGPGVIVLRDNQTGETLKTFRVGWLNGYRDSVSWHGNVVSIMGLDQEDHDDQGMWPLPPAPQLSAPGVSAR
jgi:hypothetical protein